MDPVECLEVARDQFILSLLVRGVARSGSFETSLVAISLGPWSIGQEEIEAVDKSRAAWGLEKIATQNLAVALDAALEDAIPHRLSHEDSTLRDYCCFVRCLRNAFSHDPYYPTWALMNSEYRRTYRLLESWDVNLADRHGTSVEPQDYRHAGGLIRLLEAGIRTLRRYREGA